MPNHPPCKSQQPGSLTCADGFVQSAYCSGIFGCPMCGGYDDKNAPACLRDSLPDHLATEAGGPLFYRGKRNG